MGKTIFNSQINGKAVAATEEEDDDGTRYIAVKRDNKVERFSPTYTPEELKAALEGDHSPQAWEIKRSRNG